MNSVPPLACRLGVKNRSGFKGGHLAKPGAFYQAAWKLRLPSRCRPALLMEVPILHRLIECERRPVEDDQLGRRSDPIKRIDCETS